MELKENEYHIMPNDEKISKLLNSTKKLKNHGANTLPNNANSNDGGAKKSIANTISHMNTNILYNQSSKDASGDLSNITTSSTGVLPCTPALSSRQHSSQVRLMSSRLFGTNSYATTTTASAPPLPHQQQGSDTTVLTVSSTSTSYRRLHTTQSPACDFVSYSTISNKIYTQAASLSQMSTCSCSNIVGLNLSSNYLIVFSCL